MTTDPVQDAAVHYDAVLGYAERMAEAEGNLAAKFVSTALTGMAYKEVDFYETYDCRTCKTRPSYVFEMMAETLDSDESILALAMKAISVAAKNGDVVALLALNEMAKAFAKQHATLEDV